MNLLRRILKILKFIFFALVALVIFGVLYVYFHPTFGDSPAGESLARIKGSPNFDGKHFKNLVTTKAVTIRLDEPGDKISNRELIKNFLFPPAGKNPQRPIKTVKLKIKNLKNGDFVWFGHSTVLFKTDHTTIITDPVFHNAAPVPFLFRPFKTAPTPAMKDLPFIDAVLISHDHYDHLDYRAIKKLHPRVGHFYVPLGVKAHLLRWGVPSAKVSEFDWYESVRVKNIKLVFTPSRHFSGRGITNHRKTLWGSWAVIAPKLKVYFSGDGGYSSEFAKIGKRFGGFDIAFIEDGAYNPRWQHVHMLPEQSAQAGIDVKAKVVLPIHWGKFDLSTHSWKDPVQRISKALDRYNRGVSAKKRVRLATPRIGEVFRLRQPPTKPWWEDES